MWVFIICWLLYNILVYLGIVLLVMVVLCVNDFVFVMVGKNVMEEDLEEFCKSVGFDKLFYV